jgi:cyclic di-GMP phosphodiesterase Gmr
MRRRVVDRLARENELREAVESALLDIHYQPIVSLATGDICGMEALARWPAGWGKVSPSEFIPIAEDTGLIGSLWAHVLRAALTSLARWRHDGLVTDEVCMSVNLSGRQLDDPDLATQLQAAIECTQVPAAALKLEITESTLIAEPEHTRDVFAQVCSGGVGLHLDDFGTGYSSLSQLGRIPLDVIKLDRSFVRSINADTKAQALVRSMVAVAQELDFKVVAEGIETESEEVFMKGLGVDYVQGFLYGQAMPAAEFERWLQDRQKLRLIA